jgi:hypothetical protein
MGLYAAAAVTETSPGSGSERWANGLQWLPELIRDGTTAFGARELLCSTASISPTIKPEIEEADPFMVYAYDVCSKFEDAGDPRDRDGRARRLLEATQSASIAAELWSGVITQAQSLQNTWLAKTGVTLATSSALTPQKALARLDKAIAVNMSNGRGMIHCTVEVLDRLVDLNAVRREGTLWLTGFDNIVVADAGYTGDRSGQSAAEEWMIATTLVEIRVGPILTTSADVNYDADGIFDRTLNDVVVWAQRDVIVMHEPHLLWHAAQVDMA